MSNWIIIKPLLFVLAFIHSYQKMHKTEEQVYEELYWNILVALTGWSIVFAPALLLMLRSERERSLDDKFIGITVERTSKTLLAIGVKIPKEVKAKKLWNKNLLFSNQFFLYFFLLFLFI
jgi:hypothetical protein